MTKEETKARFQSWCQREIGNHCSKEDYAMFNNIMALLEQQDVHDTNVGKMDSDDCVSRAEVLKQMKEWRDCEFIKVTNPYHYLEKRIQSMPPVTPTRKVGKWIDCGFVDKSFREYKCSNCSNFVYEKEYSIKYHKYCLHCGAEKRGNENE